MNAISHCNQRLQQVASLISSSSSSPADGGVNKWHGLLVSVAGTSDCTPHMIRSKSSETCSRFCSPAVDQYLNASQAAFKLTLTLNVTRAEHFTRAPGFPHQP